MNTYENAIKILTSHKKFHIKLGLERVSQVLKLLKNPQNSLEFIHVAGTNGKGSVCAMLSAILKQTGYKTGLFTSPHLVDYTERIKINGIDISQDDFARIFNIVNECCNTNNIEMTEFEIITVMAFLYFKEQKTDIVVLETGLGGRLDSTNVIENNILSIITTIDFDHEDRLGKTIDEIAFEKAGIIKENSHVVILESNKGIEVVKKTALEKRSEVACAKDNYEIVDKNKNIFSNTQNSYELSLLGIWNKQNLPLVVEAINILNKKGLNISEHVLNKALKKVIWHARFQFVKEKNIIIDGAHNPASAIKLRESLDFYFPEKERVWLYGSLNNKDYSKAVKSLFKEGDEVILCDSFSPNACNTDILEDLIVKNYDKIKISKCKDVIESVNELYKRVCDSKTLIVAGSLYLCGDVIKLLKKDFIL